MVGPVELLVSGVSLARDVGGRDADDATRAHRDRMLLEHASVRLDWDHPACADERVDELHADEIERRGKQYSGW